MLNNFWEKTFRVDLEPKERVKRFDGGLAGHDWLNWCRQLSSITPFKPYEPILQIGRYEVAEGNRIVFAGFCDSEGYFYREQVSHPPDSEDAISYCNREFETYAEASVVTTSPFH